MPSSPESSPRPLSPLPPDLSERERCVLALHQQLQASLASLPDSSAQCWAPLLAQLSAMSETDRSENAALLGALGNYHAQGQSLLQLVRTLTAQLAALEKKLETLAADYAQLRAVLATERCQRQQLADDILGLSAQIRDLKSQLAALNAYAPP
jgi:chromosome segregation ATPase